jgi:hypothetical protein
VLPRVLLVNEWKQADFPALVTTGRWPQFDPRKTVLLDKVPPKAGPTVRHPASPPVTSSRVWIRHYENTRVVIEIEAAQAGFVVLHDLWHPWWTAELDGKESPILRANVLFRAVQVPTGRHVLTFEFKPISSAVADVSEWLLEPFQGR